VFRVSSRPGRRKFKAVQAQFTDKEIVLVAKTKKGKKKKEDELTKEELAELEELEDLDDLEDDDEDDEDEVDDDDTDDEDDDDDSDDEDEDDDDSEDDDDDDDEDEDDDDDEDEDEDEEDDDDADDDEDEEDEGEEPPAKKSKKSKSKKGKSRASADGKVVEAYDTDSEDPPYGSVVTIEHDSVWKTQYVHLNDALAVKKGDTVVRGQRIGTVGQIAGLEPHLHYVQLQHGQAVRITFNGVAIAVHAGAKKPDGTYPTQNLTSANAPTGITKTALENGTTAKCQKGAGLRATVKCFFPKLNKHVTKHGPWVGAKGTSTVKCAGSQEATGHGYETS